MAMNPNDTEITSIPANGTPIAEQASTATPEAAPAAPVSAKSGRVASLKSIFLKVLISCLIASAAVAVVAILAGGLGDIGSKALWTIVIVALHSLFALGFLNMNETHSETGDLKVFANVVFGIIILSFISATLGVWGVIPSDVAWKMYLCYGVLIVAVLHGEVLARMLNHQRSITNTIYANFVIMALVVAMLWGWILSPELVEVMSPYYLRVLAALAVIDGTLTLTAVILDRLYLSKNPELITSNSVVTRSHGNGPTIIVVVVTILIVLQMLPALIFAFLR